MQARIKDAIDFSQEILVGRSETDFAGDKNKISKFLSKRERKGSLICDIDLAIEFDSGRTAITYAGHSLLQTDQVSRDYAVSLLGIELEELAEYIASILNVNGNAITNINILSCCSAVAPRDSNKFFEEIRGDLSFCEKLILEIASYFDKDDPRLDDLVVTGSMGNVVFGNNGRVTVKGKRHDIVREKSSCQDSTIYQFDRDSGFVSIHVKGFFNFWASKLLVENSEQSPYLFSQSKETLFARRSIESRSDSDYDSDYDSGYEKEFEVNERNSNRYDVLKIL